ncbi:uncharacterized protein EV154DRAFT_481116 [Mucor mucedo]|uniref:uncharacterized protein n=1 Tax=Mucor mucedo TaxID=29922 RepID=UPI00221EE473|nr:uncharacterized protein EV154DRAFT_481116 [Mucor mucedo]KAI7891694.1 hypothetical protein EV154DRAFT_481116 [Mucor mucedo]
MDTSFDTDLVGTGTVALAFQNCFRTGVYLLRGFCTGVDALHSLRHRFRALAWQLGSALACNFAFNTAFGTGVYHLRASALASISCCIPFDTDTRFDTGLGFGMTLARTGSHWLSILLSVLAFANGWVINEAKKRWIKKKKDYALNFLKKSVAAVLRSWSEAKIL